MAEVYRLFPNILVDHRCENFGVLAILGHSPMNDRRSREFLMIFLTEIRNDLSYLVYFATNFEKLATY